MHIIRDLNHLSPYHEGCVATIGNFDGLHLGHQSVFAHLKEKSKEMGLPATVISFDPLPHEFFPGDTPLRIYPQRDKMRLLKKLGIDDFIRLKFNKEFASIEAEDFVTNTLLDQLKVRYLAVGDDFRFGKMRKGDFQLLQKLGEKHGMEVQDTSTFKADDERISSTRVRSALQAGDLPEANRLLGYHPYSLSGRIRHGDKLGRTIGFPTLNLKLPETIALRSGIYAVKIYGLGDEVLYGAASVGKRPTVNGSDMRLETYVFDFDQDVYGKYICIEPVAFIRPEEKFESLEEMQDVIHQDCDQIKTLFKI